MHDSYEHSFYIHHVFCYLPKKYTIGQKLLIKYVLVFYFIQKNNRNNKNNHFQYKVKGRQNANKVGMAQEVNIVPKM